MSSVAEASRAAQALPARRSTSALARFARHRAASFGMVTIVVLVLGSWIGPHLLPFDDLQIDILNRFKPPLTGAHLLGTDQLGRDLLARLMMAGRISLVVGFTAMALSSAIGIVIGAVAGYYGHVVGAILMRFVDAMLCFPTMFILLTLVAFVSPGLVTITLIIAFTAWMEMARVVEGQMRSLRERDFAVAAEMMGASDRYMIFRELLPNMTGTIMAAATLIVARAILLESYVSYLGYGIQPPVPSWGNMLNNAQQYLTSAPWLALVPGVAITLAVTSFNFLGDGLRDALDPRVEGS